MSQKTKTCRIVGAAEFKIGQPILQDATTSTVATIDFQSYVSGGSFTFKNNVIDNTGQNRKKSMQYGQDEVSAELTFFAVDNTDVDNPLNIIRKAMIEHKAVPIYYKESNSATADGFDGDMVVEADEFPIPDSDEVKVKVTLHPTNNYRVWKRLREV